MDLDIRQMLLLEALGQGDNLTAAAARLFVSQPALSQRLGALERTLGSELFERRSRALLPTAAGRRMIAAARSVLAELRAAQHDVQQLGSGEPDVVRLATQCSSNFQWLPPVLRQFATRWPAAEVRIENAATERPVAAVLEGRLDLAIVTKQEPLMEQVELRPLFEDEMVAVVARSHPWAAREFVLARDFDGVHLIVHEGYDQARIPAVPLPIPAGARPRRVTPMPFVIELILQLVASGEAVTVLPTWSLGSHLRTFGLATVGLTQKRMRRTWYRATSRGDLRPHLQAFVECLDAQFAGPARRAQRARAKAGRA